MFDSPPDIFACKIQSDGNLQFTNETRIEPFMYSAGSLIYPAVPCTMQNNDIFIYTNTHIKRVFIEYSIELAAIFNDNRDEPAEIMKKAVTDFLSSKNIIREKSFFSLFLYRKGK